MTRDPYKYFRIEARELLAGLGEGVLQLEKGPSSPEAVARLLRFAHTLKGAARVVKLPAIAELAHEMEGVLAEERAGARPLEPAQASRLLSLCDQIGAQLLQLGEMPSPSTSASASTSASSSSSPSSSTGANASSSGDAEENVNVNSHSHLPTPASEEQFQTVRVEIEEMDRLLSGITEAGILLGTVRRDLASVERLSELSATLREILLHTREAVEQAPPNLRASLLRAREIAEEQETRIGGLQRDLALDLERSERGLVSVRDLAQRLRLLPVKAIFPSLERAVRDAALATNKEAQLITSGGEVRFDAGVLAALRDALVQVMRNAVAHGIESAPERAQQGKSAVGQIQLEVQRWGNRARFICRDDGRGVDLEAVRGAAVARGLRSPAQAAAMSTDELTALLFKSGMTTSRELTEISGRGIGLDLVRETVERLKGTVVLRSEAGRGALLTLQVPISIASLTGLLVESAGEKVAIPLDSVRETLRLKETDLLRSPEQDSLLHQGQVIPFVSLERLLGQGERLLGQGERLLGQGAQALAHAAKKKQRQGAETISAVLLRADGRLAALGVDRCCGAESIVARTLPVGVVADAIVAGASLDAEGNPQLVLDPLALVERACRGRGAASEEKAKARAPILVIDDSLTTRMLEQSILESAGYEVELAVSAEEGIRKARERSYSLFLVDVEMPGMDGFEFVARTRSDPALSLVPAILVTSRNAVEDKQRGLAAGASAYVVKGEFDQRQLLQTIRSLLG